MISCPKCQRLLKPDSYLHARRTGYIVYNHTGANITNCSGHLAIENNTIISYNLYFNEDYAIIYNGKDPPWLSSTNGNMGSNNIIISHSLEEFENNLQRIKDLLIYA